MTVFYAQRQGVLLIVLSPDPGIVFFYSIFFFIPIGTGLNHEGGIDVIAI